MVWSIQEDAYRLYTDTTPFYIRSEYPWVLISVGARVLEPVPSRYFGHQGTTVFCLCSLTEFLSGQLSISDTWSCASSGEKSNLLKCQSCPKHCWHFFNKYEPSSSMCLSYRYWRHKSVVQDGSLFSTPSPTSIVCRFFFFDDGHAERCEVIPHCSFDLHFSNNGWLYFSGLQNHCRWWLQPWN